MLMQIIEREFLINRDVSGGMNIESAEHIMEISLRVRDTGVIDAGDAREDSLLELRCESQIESVAAEYTKDLHVLS